VQVLDRAPAVARKRQPSQEVQRPKRKAGLARLRVKPPELADSAPQRAPGRRRLPVVHRPVM
jgi:hypothetical protein